MGLESFVYRLIPWLLLLHTHTCKLDHITGSRGVKAAEGADAAVRLQELPEGLHHIMRQ